MSLRTSIVSISLLLVMACSVTKPVTTVPTPASIQVYVRRHPHATLRIADTTGRRRWIYEASVRGDTLRGLRNSSTPRDSIAVPLHQVTEVAAPRFSAIRTFGLLGGMAAVVGMYALLLPEPDF